jgi:hypothetical protein
MDTHGKENQKRGGGPKTPAGKRHSAKNATKHGFFITRVLPEEEKDARALHAAFIEEFQPAGRLEGEIVGDIVINRLQKRRIDRSYACAFDFAARERAERRLELRASHDANAYLRLADTYANPIAARSGEDRLPSHHCTSLLRQLRNFAEENALDELERGLQVVYGKNFTPGAARLVFLCEHLKRGQQSDGGPNSLSQTDRDTARTEILETIDVEINRHVGEQEFQERADAADHSRDTPGIPSDDVLDRHLRCGTANQRELLRCLEQLEKIRKLKNPD